MQESAESAWYVWAWDAAVFSALDSMVFQNSRIFGLQFLQNWRCPSGKKLDSWAITFKSLKLDSVGFEKLSILKTPIRPAIRHAVESHWLNKQRKNPFHEGPLPACLAAPSRVVCNLTRGRGSRWRGSLPPRKEQPLPSGAADSPEVGSD